MKIYLPSLIASLALAVGSINAAEPVSLQTSSLNDLQQTFQFTLPGIKQSMAVSVDSLQFLKQHTDEKRKTHIRMQQHYAGLPVFGGYAIIHSTRTAKSLLAAKGDVRMNGMIYKGLKTELGQPSKEFFERANEALQQFKAQYQGYPLSEEQVTPMVYIDNKHQAFWAYRVSVLVSPEDRIPERPTAIVDALTYKPFLQWNNLKTVRSPVKGRGYGGNRRTGRYEFGKDLPFLQIARDSVAEICYMENKDVRVVDMVYRQEGPSIPMRFSCSHGADIPSSAFWTGYEADGYDRENGAYSPANDALYAGQVIRNMYKDWYDLDVLVTSYGKPMQLVMRVHFGIGYNNAFWDGGRMTFGDGDDETFPLVSLGIAAHEISHGFT